MEFTPITTQEEFNAAIKSRLEQQQRTITEKYADYEDLKTKVSGFESQVGDLNAALDSANKKLANHTTELEERDKKISAYETASVKTRIAHEIGLSYEATSFLSGNDEDSIRKSAESLKALVGSSKGVPPLATNEPANYDKEDNNQAAYKELLTGLKGE